MFTGIKKLFATDESRSSVMFVSGVLSLLAALAVAAAIWQRWSDVGVLLGPRSFPAVVLGSVVGILLACSSGIWALTFVNRLSGHNAIKCILGYLLGALALAIIGAFLVIAVSLKAVVPV